MGNGDPKREMKLSDGLTIGFAALALLVSGVTLYDQFLRGPALRAYPPNLVYVTKSQIGIPAAFTNAGTATDVIVDGSLEISEEASGPPQTLKLRWVSPLRSS